MDDQENVETKRGHLLIIYLSSQLAKGKSIDVEGSSLTSLSRTRTNTVHSKARVRVGTFLAWEFGWQSYQITRCKVVGLGRKTMVGQIKMIHPISMSTFELLICKRDANESTE